MNKYKSIFRSSVVSELPGEPDDILNELENEFALIQPSIQFAGTSSNPLDKRGKSYDVIKAFCIKIAKEYVRPKNRLQAMLKKLPVAFINTPVFKIVIKKLQKRVRKKGHPEGFEATVITGKNETFGLGYGIDITECGICKLFNKYGYGRFSSILCEVDYITSDLAGLKLIRSSTIASGAKKCDFRYQKV